MDSYTKTEVDDLLSDKVNTDDLVDAYSKTEIDNLLADKADSTDIVDAYTKGEVDGFLADKANVDDIVDSYTKTEVDGLLTAKVDTTALDGKLDKTAIVTSLSSTSTDEQVPSALATKTYVDSKEVKISTEENNKIETKSDGIFVSKDYVEITQDEYDLLTEEEKEGIIFYITDGVSDNKLVTVIDNTCTDEQVPSAKAVHTAIQESKTELENGITSTLSDYSTKRETANTLSYYATTAFVTNTLNNTLADYATNAYVQEQLKKAGDYMGKTMVNVSTNDVGTSSGYTYTNTKGGLADFVLRTTDEDEPEFNLIVDGVTIVTNGVPVDILKPIVRADYTYELKIPFDSTFTVKHYCAGNNVTWLKGFIYVNN